MVKVEDFSVLTPAFGRDYQRQAEVVKAFKGGDTFVLNHYTGASIYCSINDCKPGTRVEIRYKQKREAVLVTV